MKFNLHQCRVRSPSNKQWPMSVSKGDRPTKLSRCAPTSAGRKGEGADGGYCGHLHESVDGHFHVGRAGYAHPQAALWGNIDKKRSMKPLPALAQQNAMVGGKSAQIWAWASACSR